MFCQADAISPLLTPQLQWGFAGLCAILLGVIVWLISKLLEVFRNSTDVIEGNTNVMRDIHTVSDDTKHLMSDIRDQLLTRPCMMRKHDV